MTRRLLYMVMIWDWNISHRLCITNNKISSFTFKLRLVLSSQNILPLHLPLLFQKLPLCLLFEWKFRYNVVSLCLVELHFTLRWMKVNDVIPCAEHEHIFLRIFLFYAPLIAWRIMMIIFVNEADEKTSKIQNRKKWNEHKKQKSWIFDQRN